MAYGFSGFSPWLAGPKAETTCSGKLLIKVVQGQGAEGGAKDKNTPFQVMSQ